MLDTTEHRDKIMSAVAALQHRVAQPSFGVQASWQRCLQTHGLDPKDRRKPPVLSEREVRSRIAILDRSEDVYRQSLSELSSLLDSSGYEVSLCDADGVTLFNLPSSLDTGSHNVERPGTTWLEAAVGTNGIGTCLWDARPVSVVGDEHFLSCYANNNCAAAPVKDCDGKIVAVINITAPSGSVSRQSHGLACEVLNRLADKVGRRIFRIEHDGCFLIELLVGRKGPGLIAVREEGTIISADLRAQAFLSLGPGPSLDVETLRGTTIWDYFDRREGLLTTRSSLRSIPLTRTTTGVQVAARSFLPQKNSIGISRRAGSLPPAVSLSAALSLEEVCGPDAAMVRNARLLERVKDLAIPVLLWGETGVGKTMLAQAMHASSARATKPYVCVSCSGVSEAVLRHELFGGSASTYRDQDGEAGRLVEADGGTLVLDEIGDLSPELQSSLVRFLETSEVAAPDGRLVRVNVGVIATSRRSLLPAVNKGDFRSDLFYRIAGAAIDIPPLRQRSDIEHMTRRIIRAHAGTRSLTISDAAIRMLAAYHWPGNLRELSNVILRAICLMDGNCIQPDHIRLDPVSPTEPGSQEPAEGRLASKETGDSLLRMADKSIIRSAMLQANGEVVAAMRNLKVSRATLYRKLKAYDLMHLTRRAQAHARISRQPH
jgi:sigma-54 dependent transcriptional regulator, acetoin dehydrogenase operon transcriptional activator AcoR